MPVAVIEESVALGSSRERPGGRLLVLEDIEGDSGVAVFGIELPG